MIILNVKGRRHRKANPEDHSVLMGSWVKIIENFRYLFKTMWIIEEMKTQFTANDFNDLDGKSALKQTLNVVNYVHTLLKYFV